MSVRAFKMKPDEFDPKTRAFPYHGKEIRRGITVDEYSVRFDLQRGPVREEGRNGCDLLDMLEFVRGTLEVFQAKTPCRENALAITKLQEAEMWLRERTREREERGVEGTSAA